MIHLSILWIKFGHVYYKIIYLEEHISKDTINRVRGKREEINHGEQPYKGKSKEAWAHDAHWYLSVQCYQCISSVFWFLGRIYCFSIKHHDISCLFGVLQKSYSIIQCASTTNWSEISSFCSHDPKTYHELNCGFSCNIIKTKFLAVKFRTIL